MANSNISSAYRFSNISNIKAKGTRLSAICPVSEKKIDENIARLVAAQTVVLLLAFAFTQHWLPVVVLLFDFGFRSAQQAAYSPLALVGKQIAKLSNLSPKIQNAGPKIFAARIGLLFSGLTFIALLFGSLPTALVFAAIFGFCALLEAAFAFCVACKIYPFIHALIYK